MRLNPLHLPDGAGLSSGLAFWDRNPETDDNRKQQQQQKKKGCQVSLWVPDCPTLLGAWPAAAPRGRPARPGPARLAPVPFPSRGRAPTRERPWPGWGGCAHTSPRIFVMSMGFLQLHRGTDLRPSLPTPALPTFLLSQGKTIWWLKAGRDTNGTYREEVEGIGREKEVRRERGKDTRRIPSITHMTC